MTEEEIIADGLGKIKDGVMSSNWQMVCDGYNIILDDDLQPPKEPEMSKLEKIRAASRKKANEPQKEVEEESEKLMISEEVLPTEIKEKKQKGGKVFGRGQIKIISTSENPKEAERNAYIAKHTSKIKIPRPAKEVKPNPETPPPWH